jgi:hypothetical protein
MMHIGCYGVCVALGCVAMVFALRVARVCVALRTAAHKYKKTNVAALDKEDGRGRGTQRETCCSRTMEEGEISTT